MKTATVPIKLLADAADIINSEADSLRGSCEVNGKPWRCHSCLNTPKEKCFARADYENMKRCVKKLRAALEPRHPSPVARHGAKP